MFLYQNYPNKGADLYLGEVEYEELYAFNISYHLKEFNMFFAKNDINVLADIFLNLNIENSRMYEYLEQRLNESFLINDGKNVTITKESMKNTDKLYSSVANIFSRLYNELQDETKKMKAIEIYSKILKGMQIINCQCVAVTKTNANKKVCFVPVKKYVKMLTNDKELQKELHNNAVRSAVKYCSNYWGDISKENKAYYKEILIKEKQIDEKEL